MQQRRRPPCGTLVGVTLTHCRTCALMPVPPFDFTKTLAFFQGFQASGTSYLIEAGTLAFTLNVVGTLVTVQLEALGSTEAPSLRCTLCASAPFPPEAEAEALGRVRFHLGLDDDLAPFYALAERDDAFRPVLAKLYGYHLVKFATPFEAACWALVTQRTPNRFAFKVMTRLAELLGERVTHENATLLVFPAPERFLFNAEESALEATNNTRKAERLLEVAKAFSAVDEGFLRTA